VCVYENGGTEFEGTGGHIGFKGTAAEGYKGMEVV